MRGVDTFKQFRSKQVELYYAARLAWRVLGN